MCSLLTEVMLQIQDILEKGQIAVLTFWASMPNVSGNKKETSVNV